jgi:ABC-type phosphate/phosphonate transport system substrate-binding protein
MRIVRFPLFGFMLLAIIGFTERTVLPAQIVNTYRVGVMAKSYDEKRAKAMEKFEEIIGKYMEEQAGIRLQLRALTYPDMMNTVQKGEVDFVWGYGLVTSMELGKRFSLIPIVAPALGEEKRSFFKRWIVASKDSVQGMADPKGKRVTYVGDEQWSFELLLLKIWAAEKLGVRDIHQYFDLRGKQPDEGFFIPASKRGAVYSLIIKEADLAVVHEFEYLTQEKLTPNAIRERTAIIPFPNAPEGFMEAPVFMKKGLNKNDIDHLIKALMEMSSNPEGKQILLSSKISGFVKVTDHDYDSVRALIAKRDVSGIK